MLKALLALILTLSATASTSLPRESEDNLTWLMAQQRKSQVKQVEYDLHFELEKGRETFEGLVTLTVDMHRLDLPLSIDLLVQKIKTVKVNGEELKKYPSRKGSFDIPQEKLTPQTRIEVSYTGRFSQEASGFKRSVDPEDGAEYFFTDFEPYYAHWLFPCFDQPDIKGIYRLRARTPKEWRVIGNELISEEKEEGERKLTTLQTSKPFSTYLFFFGAGPYVEWKDDYKGLPLFLWARKSLAKHVDHENIFATTKAGLKFFNDYFNYPYPFSKYGHIFIPEFAWGGMENPGAVTLNERNIFRGPVPQSKREKRDNLLMHEMAHMWFGDLVTMEWWNDLWLNESFATYLASIAQERALSSKATWMEFFQTKSWGYWQDQLVTTHPIETEVPDVRTAKSNFDGITYAKGAASLKQLHFFVGENGFRDGLRNYFKTFAFSNTRRENFTGAIALAGKTDLNEWTTKWLQTAGPNRVKVEFSCEHGKLKQVSVHQRPSSSGNLSPHRTRLGLYRLKDDKLVLQKTHEVLYRNETHAVDKLAGERCPDFLFPNMDDLDYALFALDENSLKHTRIALSTIEDPLVRIMLWNMLTQMVRDAELAPAAFFELAFEGLKKEENDLLLGGILSSRRSVLRDQWFLYLTPEERGKLAPAFEAVLWQRITESKPGSSLQMSFFDFLLTVAQTPDTQQKLHSMLVKNVPPEGIVLDQDRRWQVLLNLAMNGHPEALKLVADELKADGSTIGKRTALAAEAAWPELKHKQKIWQRLIDGKGLTYNDRDEAGKFIHSPNHPELTRKLIPSYFKSLKRVDWSTQDDVVDLYFERFFPLMACSPELVKQSEKELKNAKKLTTIARRGWREAQDELTRCVRVRGVKSEVPGVR